ncbi:MAG: type I-E CRISPR-associated protein Cse1/CasA [Desulfoprunum sp.]|nr:type I-E CRISPR-associated protein Cse1/CasA [Desulfoprunum sp.]
MNLLADQWIPVRPFDVGGAEKISLQELLCGEKKWELCLPRDDMELAALQLLICISQALFTPKGTAELRSRIVKPITVSEYDVAVQAVTDWFFLDHPKHPFMQVRGVPAKDSTPMDKLLAGLTGATNSCFVNQAGLAGGLCGGCAAIVLFNQASCAPSFGGGFKAGLRGSSPITTLVQGDHLRRTVWLNILSGDELVQTFSWHGDTAMQKPTWIEPIKAGEAVSSQRIGFIRGLLWQPDHIELLSPVAAKSCSCCGSRTDTAYTAFNKAKFSYTVVGTWPHPHSPRIMSSKKGETEEKFAAFTTSAPAWTQLSRFVVQQQIDATNTVGQQPAAVILQARKILGAQSRKLHLLIGGYRNNQASVLDRRHEVFTLNHGWDSNTNVIHYLVALGRGYRDALYKALYVFVNGIKDIKGAGVKLNQAAESQFYRRTEPTIEDTLARVDFTEPEQELARMRKSLKSITVDIFQESVRPYLNDPELIRTLAVARRTLYKHLNNLEPQKDKGEDNGKTETP